MASNTTSSVTPNAQTAVAYLQSKGWTAAQAQGIVGNFQQESGVNLNINATGDGGTAYGIAQWHPDRQANFQKQYGFPIQQASLSQQLEFVNYELTQGNERAAGAKIRATKTPGEAAVVTDQYYERSNGASRSKRIDYANALAGAPGGSVPPLAPGNTPPTSTKPTVEPAGDNTFYKVPGGDSAKNAGSPILNKEPDAIDVSQPLMNVLHQYPSYIYGLSLHLLNPTEYNNIVAGNPYVPGRVLVASAGRYNNVSGAKQFIRSPYFAEDFYFNNFNMTTVIGTNATSRNTNAIEFAFTLLEPYGMTLINRLLDQANDPVMQCDNYLDMIYLLQIDFFASNDAGEIVGIIPDTTKRFPIKITQMNIKAGVQGSEYQIQAVPYNHSAFELTTVSTPANFEVVAGSVGEFFQGGTATNSQSQVTSYTGAMNGWQNNLSQDNKIGVPDTYNFNIDPVIAQSSFTSGKAVSARDTSMASTNDTNAIRQSNLGNPTSSFSSQSRTFSINAGTSVDKVVDYAIRNSDYIQNQIAIPDGVDPQTYLQQKSQNADQPLNWYKIVPTVAVGPFDPVRKIYSRNITYHVQPYTIYNVKSDVAPQGKATQFVKSYNYIYTGKNDDVLDFEINFNTLYYTAQTAYRSALSDIFKSPDTNTQSKNSASQNASIYQGAVQNSNSVMPMVVKPQVYNAKARATGGGMTAKSVAVADLEDSLMTASTADMLNVQLKILGDPQFIKQDDCFYTPAALAAGVSADPRLTPNGSLRTDYGEIYVLLTFRTPIDLDENTGLMNFGPKYRTSLFSGLYRVLTVTSEFQGGQFVQTLNIIRLPNQAAYDYITQNQLADVQRQTDMTPTITDIHTGNQLIQDVPTPIPSILISESTDQPPSQQLIDAASNFDQSPIAQTQQDLINLNNTVPSILISNTTGI
jgi:hypothetical protein